MVASAKSDETESKSRSAVWGFGRDEHGDPHDAGNGILKGRGRRICNGDGGEVGSDMKMKLCTRRMELMCGAEGQREKGGRQAWLATGWTGEKEERSGWARLAAKETEKEKECGP